MFPPPRRRRALFVVLLLGVVALAAADSLYGPEDPILELDVTNFHDKVYNQERAFFVEFYSSWCGACIAYAPTFKKFASMLKSWAPLVQVTVVNCAEDRNMPLCREHEINAFPTLKYFKYRSADKADGLRYQGDKYKLENLSQDVAGLVQADAATQHPTGWPSFLHVDRATTLDALWAQVPASTRFLGVAVHSEPAKDGWALTINYATHPELKIFIAHPDAAHIFGAPEGDRFLLYKRGDPKPLFISEASAGWKTVQEKVDELLGIHTAEEPKSVLAAPVGAVPQPHPQYEVQMLDLVSAMSYMLRSEISRREKIDAENLDYLKAWIKMLKKYAPGSTPLRRLFHRLDEWLSTQKDAVTATQWVHQVEAINEELGFPLPKEVRWLACQGTKPNLRGYTCGLWTLQHAITVQAFKLELTNPAFRPALDVLQPFRDFIVNFLSCSECAQNFAKESQDHRMEAVTRAEDAVLWLWTVHNSVNKRLSGAPAEDPAYPKKQFPDKSTCPDCQLPSGIWDEKKVLDHLVSYYSDIKQDGMQPSVEYNAKTFDGNGQKVADEQRRFNPRFRVDAQNVDKLEEQAKLSGDPLRHSKPIEPLDPMIDDATGGATNRHAFLVFVLSAIGVALLVAYAQYRRNRSKFWKTFYYYNDYKL